MELRGKLVQGTLAITIHHPQRVNLGDRSDLPRVLQSPIVQLLIVFVVLLDYLLKYIRQVIETKVAHGVGVWGLRCRPPKNTADELEGFVKT